ncbi:helix-turn-helix transcriptional regulator [Roseiconus lacunae]|uniref:helix-turn-helix transcriptional regulator n=1 Tax=Roseiconus lacunae TaxID=2605694 RepID=UPI001E46B0C8|nr:helix-turn-helix domain-containing protein [Roseiconus lacunae]MCD0459213.1 helix-turn-helix domain-containing protein [Roseiconus lacunae]
MNASQNLAASVRDGRQRAMMSVDDVADELNCSARHVRRLADSGRMPRPIKLGTLVRWPRAAIEQWIGDGCPNVRNVNRGGRR